VVTFRQCDAGQYQCFMISFMTSAVFDPSLLTLYSVDKLQFLPCDAILAQYNLCCGRVSVRICLCACPMNIFSHPLVLSRC